MNKYTPEAWWMDVSFLHTWNWYCGGSCSSHCAATVGSVVTVAVVGEVNIVDMGCFMTMRTEGITLPPSAEGADLTCKVSILYSECVLHFVNSPCFYRYFMSFLTSLLQITRIKKNCTPPCPIFKDKCH